MARGILQFLAGMGNGYIATDDKMRKREQEDRAEKRSQESHDAQMGQIAEAKAEKQALKDAARPVTTEQGAGGALRPASADDRDVGQPGEPGAAAGGLGPQFRVGGQDFASESGAQAASIQQNSPEAKQGRIAAALEATGNPLAAAQYDSAVTQGKAAKFTLSKEQEKWANEQFDKKLATIGSIDQLRDVLNGSKLVGGDKVDTVTTPDGKISLVRVGADGKQVALNAKPMENTPEGIKKALVQFSQSMSAAEKIGALQHIDTFEEGRRQFAENKRLQEMQINETGRHNRVSEATAGAHLGIASQTLGLQREKFESDLKNDPTRNMTGPHKAMLAGYDKALAGIESAITTAQAKNEWDPKAENSKLLLKRQAALQGQRNDVLKQYAGNGTAADTGYPGAQNRTAAPPAGAAPTPPAGAGPVLTRPGAAPRPAPAPVAATPSAPAVDPLLAALGADGSASIDSIVAKKAPALRDAAQAYQQASQQLAAAGKSGDASAIPQYMQRATAARQVVDNMVKDMQPQQAQKVLQALGL